MSRFPEFKGLDPKVFLGAARLGARKGEQCVGACHLLAERLDRVVVNPYSKALCAVFEPQDGNGWRPAFFLAYTWEHSRYERLPNSVIFERRQLVLLLCAELAKEANEN